MDESRTTILVTGASGGIGAELVRKLDRDRFDIWTAGRRPCPDVAATHFDVDFSDRAAVDAFLARLALRGRRIDILVNNAATVSSRLLEADGLAENFLVNVLAPARITQFLQTEELLGCVINLVSSSAIAPRRLADASRQLGIKGYFESKYLFVQLQRHLAERTGTHCLFYSPGATNTGLQGQLLQSFFRFRSPVLRRLVNALNGMTLTSTTRAVQELARLCDAPGRLPTLSLVDAKGRCKPLAVPALREEDACLLRGALDGPALPLAPLRT